MGEAAEVVVLKIGSFLSTILQPANRGANYMHTTLVRPADGPRGADASVTQGSKAKFRERGFYDKRK